jgi:hypothetical protein
MTWLKKQLFLGLATAVVVGCGGGGGSTTNTTTNNNQPKTGTGYYVDSNITGANFVCGSISGVTDNGRFEFERGEGCKFSLGDIILREVNASILEDGVIIFENNIQVAKLLLSLDSDANATNGITISKEAIDLLKEKSFNHIPTDDEISDLVDELKDNNKTEYKGKTYSQEEVIAHLNETRKKTHDTTPPTITLIGDNPLLINQFGEFNDPGASAVDVLGLSVDVEVNATVNTDIVGDYNVTYSAVDAIGNRATAIRVVRVIDVTPPVITLQGENPFIAEVGTNFTIPGATAVDAVDGNVSVIIRDDEVNSTKIGEYTVEYFATDRAGNEANVTRVIKVIDTTPPVITLNGNEHMDVLLNSTFDDPGATATDNSGENITVEVNGTVNSRVAGDYTLTYIAVDSSGNRATKTRSVSIILGQAPNLTVDENNITIEVGSTFTPPNATATDAEEGNISDRIQISSDVNASKIGHYTITYSVTDAQGNSVSKIVNVNVVDTTPPVITLNGSEHLNILLDSNFTDPGAIATDNSGENITVEVNGTVDTSVEGDYTLTYIAVDSSGNRATKTRSVNVGLGNVPVITLNGPAEMTLFVGDEYQEPGATATDVEDGNLTASIVIEGSVNTNTIGNYIISYKVTDSHGNQATKSRTVHIIDFKANNDEVNATRVEPITVNVLRNDAIPNGATVELYLIDSDNDNPTQNPVSDGFGTWSIDNNSIVFTPSSDFSSDFVSIGYEIKLGNKTSRGYIRISFPIEPSLECNTTTLSSIDDIVNAIVNRSIDVYKNDDTEKRFKTRIKPKYGYIISEDLFEDSNIDIGLAINPFYFVKYEESNHHNYQTVELETTRVYFNESSNSWGFRESKVENYNGDKYSKTKGAEGSYEKSQSNGSYALSIGEEHIIDFKLIKVIDTTTLQNMFNQMDINISLEDSDKAALLIEKQISTEYYWEEDRAEEENITANSLSDIIDRFKYDSSKEDGYDYDMFHNRNTYKKTIVFAADSTGNSGRLVEVYTPNNTIISNDAGTWEITSVESDSGNSYEVLIVKPKLCGYHYNEYEPKVFKISNGLAVEGDVDIAGTTEANFVYSSSLAAKLKDYFEEYAPLDVTEDSNISFSKNITLDEYNDAQAQQFAKISYYSLKLKHNEDGDLKIREKIATIHDSNITFTEVRDDGNRSMDIPYTNDNNEIQIYNENGDLSRAQKLIETLDANELNNQFDDIGGFSGGDKGYKFVVKDHEDGDWEYQEVIWFNESAASKVKTYLQNLIND